jgi:uncharacterized repeat protein (TIGR01451 family)
VITNTGVVKNPDDINPTNDTSTITETITGTPDLAMDKEIVQPLIFGRNATFTLTVTNVGNGATTGLITVTDQLPAGFTYVSASGIGWTCSASGQLLTCTNPGPLAPKASSVITLVTTTPPQQINTENTAVVKTPGDPNPGNDSDTVPIGGGTPQIDLETTKSASSTAFSVGQPASYTIIVRNISGVPTTVPITVTDAVPAQLTLVSASGTGWTCSISGQLLTCTYAGILQPGAAAVVTVNVIPLPAAIPSVRNIAVGTSPEDSTPPTTPRPSTRRSVGSSTSLQKESVGALPDRTDGLQPHHSQHGIDRRRGAITVRDTLRPDSPSSGDRDGMGLLRVG